MVRLARLHGSQDRDRGRLSTARRCAYRVVRRVTDEGAYADRAFTAEAERYELSPRDRAFAQQLVYGTLQRQATLDYVLTALSARPVEAIDPPLRDALRIGLYQLHLPRQRAGSRRGGADRGAGEARARRRPPLRERGDAARLPRGPGPAWRS